MCNENINLCEMMPSVSSTWASAKTKMSFLNNLVRVLTTDQFGCILYPSISKFLWQRGCLQVLAHAFFIISFYLNFAKLFMCANHVIAVPPPDGEGA